MADGGKEEKEVVHENSYEFHKTKVDYYKEKVKNLNQDGVFYLDGKELKFAPSSTIFGFGQLNKMRFYSVWLATRDHFNNFILLVILVNSLMMGARDYLDPDNLTQHN